MNKSIEFIKQRITGNTKNMSLEEFKDLNVIQFNKVFNIEEKETKTILSYEDSPVSTITYNPSADFDYFTSETCHCDGTLLFMYELIENIINKIIELKTVSQDFVQAIHTIEVQGEKLDLSKYRFHYIVGDFVTNIQIVESPIKDKPWMTGKFTVMLPIKFRIEQLE